jgi:hypothetical protein
MTFYQKNNIYINNYKMKNNSNKKTHLIITSIAVLLSAACLVLFMKANVIKFNHELMPSEKKYNLNQLLEDDKDTYNKVFISLLITLSSNVICLLVCLFAKPNKLSKIIKYITYIINLGTASLLIYYMSQLKDSFDIITDQINNYQGMYINTNGFTLLFILTMISCGYNCAYTLFYIFTKM